MWLKPQSSIDSFYRWLKPTAIPLKSITVRFSGRVIRRAESGFSHIPKARNLSKLLEVLNGIPPQFHYDLFAETSIEQ